MASPQDVINKIKEEKIRPRPKWKILLKNYAYWMILVVMILFGAAVLSMTLAGLFDLHPGLQGGISFGRYFWLVFATLPLAWLLLGIAALAFGIMAFHKTKHGYRYRNLFVVALSVLVISSLAFLAHFGNFSRKVESAFDRSVPGSFRQFAPPKEGRFFQPEAGLIAGRVVQIGNDYFILLNHRDDQWRVIVLEKTKFLNIPQMEEGIRVFVSGREAGNKIFEADIVRRLDPPGPMVRGRFMGR